MSSESPAGDHLPAPDAASARTARAAELDRAFTALLRGAMKQALPPGWRAAAKSATWRSASGNWAHLAVHRPTLVADGVQYQFYAGVSSSHLTRHVHGRDPDRPPPTYDAPVLSCLRVDWTDRADVAQLPTTRPAPAALPLWGGVSSSDDDVVLLTPDTATEWLVDFLTRLTRRIAEVVDDRPMRDYLLAGAAAWGDVDYTALRTAALLTKHLGLDDELPGVLDRARTARHRGEPPELWDRPAQYDRRRDTRILWSHHRFLRQLAELPP